MELWTWKTDLKNDLGEKYKLIHTRLVRIYSGSFMIFGWNFSFTVQFCLVIRWIRTELMVFHVISGYKKKPQWKK